MYMRPATFRTIQTSAVYLFSTTLMVFVVTLPSHSYAAGQGNDKNKNNGDENNKNNNSDSLVIAPLMGTSTGNQDSPQPAPPLHAPVNTSTTTPAHTTTNNDVASSTPAAPATTTPDQARETQSEKDTPRDNPTYNQNLESILNQTITPIATDTPAVSKPKPVSPPKSLTLPQKPASTSISTSTPATIDNSTQATSTAGIFKRLGSGDSNQFAPSNYYIPLDTLSPDMTYGLSGLALISGIVGSMLVLREPRERLVWVTKFPEQSLLES
jgi:hypothetical protein